MYFWESIRERQDGKFVFTCLPRRGGQGGYLRFKYEHGEEEGAWDVYCMYL